MADQSLLNEQQDLLMMFLTVAWDKVGETRGDDVEALWGAAEAAAKALREGGTWPDIQWVEEIVMMGGNACSMAVLGHSQYPRFKELCSVFYQEILDRRWLQGGPTGTLEAKEVQNLGTAVGQWQIYNPPTPTQPEPKKRGWFGRS